MRPVAAYGERRIYVAAYVVARNSLSLSLVRKRDPRFSKYPDEFSSGDIRRYRFARERRARRTSGDTRINCSEI